jgi:hypothetical protein
VDRRPVGRCASALARRGSELVKGQGGDSEALLQRSPRRGRTPCRHLVSFPSLPARREGDQAEVVMEQVRAGRTCWGTFTDFISRLAGCVGGGRVNSTNQHIFSGKSRSNSSESHTPRSTQLGETGVGAGAPRKTISSAEDEELRDRGSLGGLRYRPLSQGAVAEWDSFSASLGVFFA